MLRQRKSKNSASSPITVKHLATCKKSPPGRYFSENRSPLSSTDSLWDGGQVCYCTGDCQHSLISSPFIVIPACPSPTSDPPPSGLLPSRNAVQVSGSIILKFICTFPLMLSFGLLKFFAVSLLGVILIFLSGLVAIKRQ